MLDQSLLENTAEQNTDSYVSQQLKVNSINQPPVSEMQDDTGSNQSETQHQLGARSDVEGMPDTSLWAPESMFNIATTDGELPKDQNVCSLDSHDWQAPTSSKASPPRNSLDTVQVSNGGEIDSKRPTLDDVYSHTRSSEAACVWTALDLTGVELMRATVSADYSLDPDVQEDWEESDGNVDEQAESVESDMDDSVVCDSSPAESPPASFSETVDITSAVDAALQSLDDKNIESEPVFRRVIHAQATGFKRGVRQSRMMDEDETDHFVRIMDNMSVHAEVGNESSRAIMDHEPVMVVGPSPIMAWKAEAMRAVRSAEDGAMTIQTLMVLAPYPELGDSMYHELVAEHLVARLLVKWVVENESVQTL